MGVAAAVASLTRGGGQIEDLRTTFRYAEALSYLRWTSKTLRVAPSIAGAANREALVWVATAGSVSKHSFIVCAGS